jgi:hypothetical protein
MEASMKFSIGLTICATALLTACGGGGGGNETAGTFANGTSVIDSSGASGAGAGGATASGSSAGAALRIDSVTAPADGVDVAGTLQLVINGSGLGNAELLPANNAQPLLGRFSVAPDGSRATLSFDTNQVPNGPLSVRIAAYDGSPGSSGITETAAMGARTWRFANAAAPAGNDSGRTARCQQMGYAATPADPNDPVVCVTYARTSTPIAQCTMFGTGYGSPEDLLEVLRNGNRVSKLYCQPGANNGVLNAGCSCLS